MQRERGRGRERERPYQCQCMWHNFKYGAPQILWTGWMLHWLNCWLLTLPTRLPLSLSVWLASFGCAGWQFDLLSVGIQLTSDGWCSTLLGHFTSTRAAPSANSYFKCPFAFSMAIILITSRQTRIATFMCQLAANTVRSKTKSFAVQFNCFYWFTNYLP